MPRFTDHSQTRFLQRRPDLFPPDSEPLSDRNIKRRMADSYRHSAQISRTEAAQRIHLPRQTCDDYFYRAEMDGPGIWVSVLKPSGCALVITYVTPSGADTQAEIDAVLDACIRSASAC